MRQYGNACKPACDISKRIATLARLIVRRGATDMRQLVLPWRQINVTTTYFYIVSINGRCI